MSKWIVMMVTISFSALLGASSASQPGERSAKRAGDELLAAIAAKDLDAVRRAISAGANLDAVDWRHLTPIVHAINSGSESIVLELLVHGATANATPGAWQIPLSAAIEAGRRGGRIVCDLSMIQVLLKFGADPNLIDDFRGDHPLHMALAFGDEECAKLLLDNGADPRLLNTHGETTMTAAVKGAAVSGNLELISLVQRSGVSINALTRKGSTAFLHAVFVGNTAVVQELIRLGGDPCIANNEGTSGISLARALRRTEILKLLQEAACNRGKDPL